jgi:predicted dehydrogenase
MDYLSRSLAYKLRKVARYIRMYGLRRTLAKVDAQRHLRRRFEVLPAPSHDFRARQTVGIIGCGNYAFSTIAHYLRSQRGDVISGAYDVEAHRAASLARRYRVPWYGTNLEEMLDLPRLSLVYIASNHASHAPYAIEALRRGINVHIEKPHVVTEEQLSDLLSAARASTARVFLGFNRPNSRFGKIVIEALARDSGPGMYSWFIAGHRIEPDHWYFSPSEGGRVLGNLCHWTDFVLRLAPAPKFPIRITPVRGSKSDSDIAVSYQFPDDSIATITFSAKGEVFEGVRECFNGHRGNTLVMIDDFARMVLHRGENRREVRGLFRDHGHRTTILRAYDVVNGTGSYDGNSELAHVAATGWLFLKTRLALEENRPLTVEDCPL